MKTKSEVYNSNNSLVLEYSRKLTEYLDSEMIDYKVVSIQDVGYINFIVIDGYTAQDAFQIGHDYALWKQRNS